MFCGYRQKKMLIPAKTITNPMMYLVVRRTVIKKEPSNVRVDRGGATSRNLRRTTPDAKHAPAAPVQRVVMRVNVFGAIVRHILRNIQPSQTRHDYKSSSRRRRRKQYF